MFSPDSRPFTQSGVEMGLTRPTVVHQLAIEELVSKHSAELVVPELPADESAAREDRVQKIITQTRIPLGGRVEL